MSRCKVLTSLALLGTVILACTSSAAQKSSTLVASNPAQEYRTIRETTNQFFQRGLLASNIDGEGKTYDLWSCDEPNEYMGDLDLEKPASRALSNLLELALTSVIWRNDLAKLGVPEEVWGPLVSNYEGKALAHGGVLKEEQDSALRTQMAATLNAYRQHSNPRLPKFIVEGGCGAGEIEVHIRLQPSDGQVFLIPVFLYKLCQAQHLNPADFKSCDRWTEVLHGTASYVSGDYLYLARWKDGSVRCGPLGFKSIDQEGKTFQITKMRSPECNPGW